MRAREGYQPTEKLDTSNPPQDTTGVPELITDYSIVATITNKEAMDRVKRISRETDTPSNYPTKPLRSVKNPDTIDRECQ